LSETTNPRLYETATKNPLFARKNLEFGFHRRGSALLRLPERNPQEFSTGVLETKPHYRAIYV